jgi:hypothetical protein
VDGFDSFWERFKTLRRLRLPRRDQVLDDYYTQLHAEYERLDSSKLPKSMTDLANEAQVLHEKDRLTWAMAFAFERMILMFLPDAEIAARAWHLRDRYRGIVTKDQYALYEKTHDPDATGDVLRNDMASLLLALTEYYAVRQGIEVERTGFSNRVQMMTGVLLLILGLSYPAIGCLLATLGPAHAVAALVIGIGVFAGGWWTGNNSWKNSGVAILVLVFAGLLVGVISHYSNPEPSQCAKGSPPFFTTLVMVIIAGLFGGAFSMLQRVQSPIMDGDPLSNLLALRTAKREILLSPILGAVGALVLYCIFDAKLLTGDLFPRMYEVKKAGSGSLDFATYLSQAGPSEGVDHAKLLVWSFLAGFSERLLPDALDRLTKQTASKDKTNK